jgi:sterol 3beta-glucosyltransferase
VDSPHNDIPMIYAYSPSVLPRPDDWGPFKQVSGYWFLDGSAAFDPPDELARFLEAGPPPVYVSFGSMIDHERDEVTRLVIEAVESAGQRAILHTGWSELGSDTLPESVIVVDEVPHDWLFPQLAAVVHHGGAGTTAAGLRAGLPTVIVAFFGDQFFWGWRVHELGVGPHWITRRKLKVDNLAEAIGMAVRDEGMRRRAAALGVRIRAEEGVTNAVSMIEKYAATGRIDALST